MAKKTEGKPELSIEELEDGGGRHSYFDNSKRWAKDDCNTDYAKDHKPVLEKVKLGSPTQQPNVRGTGSNYRHKR